MVSGEQAAPATIDLCTCSLLILYLLSQHCTLSAGQQESARALQQRLCTAPWASLEERQQAHSLVLRLELLLGRREG
jgi:hypothetical protein